MISDTQTTRDKIMLAAIELMAEMGYEGTTTKDISKAAGVNEVTLFRHFGTKEKLLESLFNRFHYADEMTRLFNEDLKENLYQDLLLISRTYHKIMNRNRKLLSIAIKGSSNLPESVHQVAKNNPEQLKHLLANYLTDMSSKGKAVITNPKLEAMSFLWMNYGAFMTSLNRNKEFSEDELNLFIEVSVRLFTKALTH